MIETARANGINIEVIMDYEKEIPFGAFDSELMHQEIYIPEGFEAVIKGNKIILEKTESKDERARKELIKHLKEGVEGYMLAGDSSDYQRWLDWVEKQGKKPKKVPIWKHWKDGIAGNGDGRQIYLIKTGNIYDISSCLGCECDYIELSELDSLLRDKQASKPKWTEEDERHYTTIIKALHSSGAITPIDMELAEKWFKSLKKMMEEQQ